MLISKTTMFIDDALMIRWWLSDKISMKYSKNIDDMDGNIENYYSFHD